MRLREFLVGTALMSFALVVTKGGPPPLFHDEASEDFAGENKETTEPGTSVSIPPAPSPLIAKDKNLRAAYYDTLSILSTTNLCSDFFGGSAASVEAFNHFIGRMRKDYLSGSIAVRMTGQTTNMLNARTGKEYRLFETVQVNAKGPFYRSRIPFSDNSFSLIGTFEPNTRQARVLIFLHELGHVVKGEDGEWLLPNDGNNDKVSKENTRRIQGICGDQIKGLDKPETKALVAGRKHANETLVPTSATPSGKQ
jgi:hypothetical protein